MARFIIEVDDKKIEDLTSPENMAERFKSGNPLKAFAISISASIIHDDIEKGVTTFTMSEDMIDDRMKPMFETAVEALIGLNATLVLEKKKEEKENEEEK